MIDLSLNIPLREDYIYKTQRRKKSATSLLSQCDVAGSDFETVGGSVWIWTSSHWDGEKYVDTIIEYDPLSISVRDWLMNHYLHQGRRWEKKVKGKYRRGVTVPMQFYYNLSYDAGSVIKMMQSDAIERLYLTGNVVIDADSGEACSGQEWPCIQVVKEKFRWREISYAEDGTILSNRMVAQNRYIEVRYLPKKYLALEPIRWRVNGKHWGGKGEHWLGSVECWDIQQFFGRVKAEGCRTGSLEAAGQATFKEGKVSGINIALSGRDDEEGAAYRKSHREEIMRYAVQDANLTARLAWSKIQDFEGAGVRMNRPYSLASVAERLAHDLCEIPTLNDEMKSSRLKGFVTRAWTSMQGGMFTATGAGLYPRIIDGDLKSAYPAAMWKLPDTTAAHWISGKGDESHLFTDWLDNRVHLSIGFAEVSIDFTVKREIYPATKLSPVFKCLINPRLVQGWFSAEEIAEYRKWEGAEIIYGEWFYCVPTTDNIPYRPFIENLFLMKESHPKGSAEYKVAKVCLVSLFGKTAQSIPDKVTKMRKCGQLWNPFYSSTITGFCRARIAEAIRCNDYEGVVGVMTDGIVFAEKRSRPVIFPPRPFDITIEGIKSNLGEWIIEIENADCLLLMSGVYSIRSRSDPDNIKSTFRGDYALFIGGDFPNNWFDFCEKYSDLSVLVRSEDFKPFYRPFSIGEARMKGDFSLINQFRVKKATVKALGDSNKRRWGKRVPKTFGDLLTKWFKSKPHERLL